MRKERGEFLCQKCEKVWDKAEGLSTLSIDIILTICKTYKTAIKIDLLLWRNLWVV